MSCPLCPWPEDPKQQALLSLGRQGLNQRRGIALDISTSGVHLTLLIQLRIGPVTLSSAVLGDITSEMWL
jgi:hypothetical protein